MGEATGRFDAFQRRHPVVGFPIAVLYKYLDDQGAYLSALITYYAFIAVFPLFLLLSSVLGFMLQDNPALREQILDSALRQVPVIGDTVQLQALQGSQIAVAVGLGGALYGAMGVTQAVQHAMNYAWSIPRNRRPNPIVLRLKSLALLSLLGLFVVITTVLSQLSPALEALGFTPNQGWFYLATLLAMVVSMGLFFGFSRIGTGAYVGNRALLPGAVLSALIWQFLQSGGGTVVRAVGRTNSTYGIFGIVLGLIAWLYLAAVALVVCTEINVVLARRLYPRSLLTPMTDDVDLTPADQRAYTAMVNAQRLKGFQRVEVSYDHDGQNATARRGETRTTPDAPPGGQTGPATAGEQERKPS